MMHSVLYCRTRRCTTFSEGERTAIVVFGNVEPHCEYAQININCHKRAGAACMRWRLYIILLLSFCRKGGPSCPLLHVLRASATADLSGEGRTTTMLCARVCICAYIPVGRGDVKIVFARESLLRFEKPFFILF